MIKTIPKLGYGKKYLHGFPEPIHSVIKNEQISQLLGRGRIFDGRSYPYSNQFPILDTNVVGKLHILRQIAILDVGVVKEAIELLDAILVEGNYSTLLGNPIEMLYSAIGQFDGESKIGVGNIFCQQFAFDQTILGSRSPHVTMGNVLLARNTDNEEIRQYVNTTREIVCINSIGENILFRLSGADFDSDTMLLTNNAILIRAAERNYHKFLVPTSMVDAKKIVRHYTKSDQSDLDIKTSVNKIGEIVNLSQELNTKLWDALNSGADFSKYEELYCEIAQLDVLSNIEIDKAKREYAVDSVAEIKRLRKKYEIRDDDGRQVKPNFFGKIARMKGYYDSVGKNYRFHNTTMDFLQHSLNSYRTSYAYTSFIPFSELLVNDAYLQKSVSYSQVERILEFVRDMRSKIRAVWDGTDENLDNYGKAILVHEIRQEYINYIKSLRISPHTAYRLMLAIEEPQNKDISRTLFYTLFSAPNQCFLDLIEQSRTPISTLTEVSDGLWDVEIYGFHFRRETAMRPKTMSDNC